MRFTKEDKIIEREQVLNAIIRNFEATCRKYNSEKISIEKKSLILQIFDYFKFLSMSEIDLYLKLLQSRRLIEVKKEYQLEVVYYTKQKPNKVNAEKEFEEVIGKWK
jgi:hypothetical protein